MIDKLSYLDERFTRENTNVKKILDDLTVVKFHLLNGNIEKAKLKIYETEFDDDFSFVIRRRYLAMIKFFENEFEESLSILSHPQFNTGKNYGIICPLKLLNYIVLNKVKELKVEWVECKKYAGTEETDNHKWFETMFKLRTITQYADNIADLKSLQSLKYDVETVKMFIKLALYTNQTKEIFRLIYDIPEEHFEDDKIRELLGFMYYRNADFKKSFNFIEDLNTPNANNIKGNIYLTQKKYKMAYAHFKLALKLKSNSFNAMERALPLTWILKQYKDGEKFTENLFTKEENRFKKLSLKAVFQVQQENYGQAQDTLDKIYSLGRFSQPHEVNQLQIYVALQLGNTSQAVDYSDLACKKGDAINCWLQLQLNIWPDFTKIIKKKKPIKLKSTDFLADLKDPQAAEKITEKVYISQREIEELDDELIILIPEETMEEDF
jgi:hypothetical protein